METVRWKLKKKVAAATGELRARQRVSSSRRVFRFFPRRLLQRFLVKRAAKWDTPKNRIKFHGREVGNKLQSSPRGARHPLTGLTRAPFYGASFYTSFPLYFEGQESVEN